MPTYQTLLPSNIYQFLNSMANLYSAIEKEMHVALLAGEKIGNLEKKLQHKYQVDSSTVRNVYHNLKGKHTSIKELKKTQIKELKSSISSIKQSIKTQEKKYQAQLKKGQSTQKQRFIIHQKKRRLQIKKHKLQKLKTQPTSLCFGTKKLFKAQYNLEQNGYANHQEWLKDWQEKRAYKSKYWQTEIVGFRTQLELRLTTNLQKHLADRLDYLYAKARKIAVVKSDLSLPENNPYTLEQILNEDWLPKQE